MTSRSVLAWCVHAYTALGLIAAAGIAVLIVQGRPEDFRAAFALMFLATFIDASDGSLARRIGVKEATPSFDGRRLDDLIDFHTYTSLPLLLIWRANLLPVNLAWVLLFPLLASAYGFSQVDAKTTDGYFLGFPSYWNVVAFYLYFLHPPNGISLILIFALALLTFVPAKYLYPSQGGRFSRVSTLLGVVWGLLLIAALARPTDASHPLILISLAYPLYYLALSWGISLRQWQRNRFGTAGS